MALKAVVLLSGEGTLLQSFIDSREQGLPLEICAVVSNRPNAGGLVRAKRAGIPTHNVDHTQFAERASFEQALSDCIDKYNPDLIILAGFMRILGGPFVDHYRNRLINIHPALLPKYKGLDTHRRAIESGDKEHGSSVHLVTRELDSGSVIAQVKLPILPDDTPETLATRTKMKEHLLYPEVVRWIAEKKLSLCSGELRWQGRVLTTPIIFNPDGEK